LAKLEVFVIGGAFFDSQCIRPTQPISLIIFHVGGRLERLGLYYSVSVTAVVLV
jgi:hypothetical protein